MRYKVIKGYTVEELAKNVHEYPYNEWMALGAPMITEWRVYDDRNKVAFEFVQILITREE